VSVAASTVTADVAAMVIAAPVGLAADALPAVGMAIAVPAGLAVDALPVAVDMIGAATIGVARHASEADHPPHVKGAKATGVAHPRHARAAIAGNS
jgi:hypothetical protein